MSAESLTHLNAFTLIGNTDVRGHAWHYRRELQQGRPNHYPGAIPVDDVASRLFHWGALARRVAVEVPCRPEDATHEVDGRPMRWAVEDTRQAVCRSDTHEVLGIHSDQYHPHQYGQWLLQDVGNLLDDDLRITSAGLLRNGAVAWVEVSVPRPTTTPDGVTFLPNLLATTSFDGSCATTYKRTITDVVCDNTRAVALRGPGEVRKIRHTLRSGHRIGETREALRLITSAAEDFSADVARLCGTPVADDQWERFVEELAPLTARSGRPLAGVHRRKAEDKRARLHQLYAHDPMVAPWRGSAHGALQAVNTYTHHHAPLRPHGVRSARNMRKTVEGEFDKLDQETWARLESILARP